MERITQFLKEKVEGSRLRRDSIPYYIETVPTLGDWLEYSETIESHFKVTALGTVSNSIYVFRLCVGDLYTVLLDIMVVCVIESGPN